MITPALALDFTTATLDPRVTFTRSGTGATRFNSGGVLVDVLANTPRFDYSLGTLICNGLLIEESRKNAIRYSEDIGNAAWLKSGIAGSFSVSANQYVSPRGAQTVAKLTLGSTGVNTIRQAATDVPSAGTYRCSTWVQVISGNVTNITFDVGNGTEGSIFSQLVSGQLTRCSTSVTKGGTNTWVDIQVTGDAGAEIAIWGVQVEFGTFTTSYIPTTTASITRNADVATMTGTNFSDWWQAGKGGTSVQAIPSTVSGIRPLIQFDDTTANEIIALRGNTTNPELFIVDGGVSQAQLDAGTIAANTPYELFGVWALDDCAAKVNNGPKVFDTAATIPTVTQARLGSDGTNYLNGHLATIDYYSGDQLSGVGRYMYTRRKNKVIQPPIF